MHLVGTPSVDHHSLRIKVATLSQAKCQVAWAEGVIKDSKVWARVLDHMSDLTLYQKTVYELNCLLCGF